MKYVVLGRSGLRVSELALGTMTFGEDWGWGASSDESRKIFDAYVQAGGNFIDTANNYTNGTSEKLVGDFIAADRDRFVVATKYSLSTDPADPNSGGNHRKSLVRSLRRSLQRLRTDRIDLLWVHAPDFMTPLDELMRALDDTVRSGQVLHVGISDAPAWIVSRANTLAELRGWSPFTALQIQYSLIQRTPERDLLPMASALGIPVTPWGALGGGVLTGKYSGKAMPKDARYAKDSFASAYLTERNLKIGDETAAVARELRCTPSQVALAWVLSRTDLVPMVPILGARTLAQLRDNLAALDVNLTPGQRERLETASRIRLGFPHDFLRNDFIRRLVHGDKPVVPPRRWS